MKSIHPAWHAWARLRSPLQLLVFASLLSACVVSDDIYPASLGLHLGYRGLRSDAFRDLDNQAMLRIDGDIRPEGWPVWLTGGVGVGQDSEEVGRTRFLFF